MTTTDAPPPRTILRRRPLPNGRAVVGGLLVALAGIGAFVAAGPDDGGAGEPFVVATRPLRAGHVLAADDLRVVMGELPPATARQVVRQVASVTGMHLVAPVAPGSLLAVDVVRRGDAGDAVVTLALPRASAVGGALRAGDRVDAYVSYGTGASSLTRLVASAAPVVEVGTASDALGASGDVEVTLGVARRNVRIDLVNAVHAGAVTLARTGPASEPPDPGHDEVHVEGPVQDGSGEP